MEGGLKYEGDKPPRMLSFSDLNLEGHGDVSGDYLLNADGVYRKKGSPIEFKINDAGKVQFKEKED